MGLYAYIAREGDDFFQQSRKIMFVCCFMGGWIGVFYIIYNIVNALYSPRSEPYAAIVVTVASIVMTAGLMGGFIVGCKTKTAPDYMVEFWSICLNFGCLQLMVSTKGLPYAPCFFAIAICLVTMQCPRYWLHLPLCFFGWCLTIYEQTLTPLGYPPLVVGGVTKYIFQDVFFRAGTVLATMVLVTWSLDVQTREFRRLLTASQSAVHMSLAVAEKLAAYDTSGATSVMKAFSTEGVADTDLVVAFSQIISNLEAYRAFIPQALLEGGNDLSASMSELPLDPESVPEEGQVPVPPTTLASLPKSEDATLLSVGDSPQISPRAADKTVGTLDTQDSSDQSPRGSLKSTPPLSPNARKVNAVVALEDPRVARLRQMGFKRFHVTLMGVSSVIKQTDASTSELHTKCQNIVATAVSVVEQCEGVVMHMHADRVYASWNAFKPCQMHQMNAAKAAHVLQGHFRDQGMHDARISVATGRGLAGFVGTATMKSPVIFGDVVDHVRVVLDYARQVGSPIIVTDGVYRKVQTQYNCSPVDVLQLSGVQGGGTGGEKVYELYSNASEMGKVEFDQLNEPYTQGFSR
eukprot:PhF_6_TR1932/c1_g1_i3/m.3024